MIQLLLARIRYQVFVEGQYRVDAYRQAGAKGLSTFHTVGLPTLDPLFWPGLPTREAILRLGLDPAKPTVLILVDDDNILPYLYAVDTLIGEASSTMFDFVALDKIGIIFVLPSASLQHHDGAPLLDEDLPHC